MKKLFFKLLFLLIISSCSTSSNVVSKSNIQKRKYQKGYYIGIKSKKIKYKNNQEISNIKTTNDLFYNEENNDISQKDELNVFASLKENDNLLINNDKTFNFRQKTRLAKNKNDFIITRKKLQQIKNNTIKNKIQKTTHKQNQITYSSTKNKTKSNEKNDSKSGKIQLTALLLVIFVGLVGAHRFYLGYIGVGIIQLLTLGCCGIWTLIDLIMIATGGLKPKNGDYSKKLK